MTEILKNVRKTLNKNVSNYCNKHDYIEQMLSNL